MTKFVLILILILCILPPLIYNYQYSSYGDDSFAHMERIDQIQEHGINAPGTRYIGQNFTWLVLLPFEDSDYSFVWFNWLACGACMLAIYLFGRKLVDKQTGLAMMVCGTLIAPSFIDLFHNGTIYNLINFYIFGLGASFCLLKWLETNRWYYFTTSLLLFMILSIYHSSSAAITIVAVTIFLLLQMVISYKKHNSIKLRKLGIYLVVFLIIGLGVGYALNPEFRNLVNWTSATDLSNGLKLNNADLSSDQQVYIWHWLVYGWSPWLGILVIVSLLILRKAKAKINWNLVGLLGCFCFVLGIGAFTQLFFDATRFSFDLGIMLALLSAYMIVLAIRARKLVKYQVAVWGMLALCALPAIIWFLSFNNAMTPADLQAVKYLNGIGAENYTTSSQAQHRIFDRFVDAEYSYPDAQYVIYRSEPQTVQCIPNKGNIWWQFNDHYPNMSRQSDYDGMLEVGNWSWGKVIVVIYKDIER